MEWTIPNILTVFRLAAAPAVALVFVAAPAPWAGWLALALFLAAAATDWLDGYLARAWNQQSAFGAMLDPIADKAMVIIALAVLFGRFGLTAWLVVPAAAILLREVAVSGLREYLGKMSLPVTRLAKWKTAVQMVALAALLAVPTDGALMWAGAVLLWAAALLTVVTGADYFAKAWPHLRAREKGESDA